MILVPARNEAPRIEGVLQRIFAAAPGVEVVVIVNGCVDDTAARAQDAGATVIHSARGYGQALLKGYRYAQVHGVKPWVVQLDADGQHPPEAIVDLVAGLERADVVIGSRFVAGGRAPGWPRRRRWTVHAMGLWTSALTGQRLRDVVSGFQAFKRGVLPVLIRDFPVELTDANVLVRLHRHGFLLAETGVVMPVRVSGESMHGGWQSAIYAGRTALAATAEARR